MTNLALTRAAQKAAAFLHTLQLPDGSFYSWSSPSRRLFRPTVTYQTVFTPAILLSALSQANLPSLEVIRQRLANWLLAQKSAHWSFNYWAASSVERKTTRYPDDLDDTFCALIALHDHDPGLITEDCLASAVRLLVATESTVGGPYRTWLVPAQTQPVWQDVDLAVNSNIACFLGKVAEPLPNLNNMMDNAIASGELRSPYYPSAYPIMYYLARAGGHSKQNELAAYILKHQRGGWWGTPLQTALAVSSLTRLGKRDACEVAVKALLRKQRPDGSWLAEAFCLDPALQGKPFYNGSAALTTGLVLEALALYMSQTPSTSAKQPRRASAGTELQTSIAQLAATDAQQLPSPLRQLSLRTLRRVQEQDANHHIALLPYLFNSSLATPLRKAMQLCAELGLANLNGWTAYTIYDDILDDEGSPLLLSVANASMRQSLQHFRQAVPSREGFQNLVHKTFNTIDAANTWELTHCRFPVADASITIGQLPRYNSSLRLAERSLGHILGPLGILAAAGIALDDPRALAIERAFKHYLVARQLNDDMHDWAEDCKRGHGTYVVTAILEHARIEPGIHSFKHLLPKLRQQFWHHTLPVLCRLIARHADHSRRQALASTLLVSAPNLFTQLTSDIDASVQRTLDEQSKAERFSSAYRSMAV